MEAQKVRKAYRGSTLPLKPLAPDEAVEDIPFSSTDTLGGPNDGNKLIDVREVHAALQISPCMRRLPEIPVFFFQHIITPSSLPLGSPSETSPAGTATTASLDQGTQNSFSAESPSTQKIKIDDVEKVLNLHLSNIVEATENERLFFAHHYYCFFLKVLKDNINFWTTFARGLEQFSKEHGHTDNVRACVGERECREILELCCSFREKILITTDTIESAGRGKSKINDYEITSIKVKLAMQILSYFRLEHLKMGCTTIPNFSNSLLATLRNPKKRSFFAEQFDSLSSKGATPVTHGSWAGESNKFCFSRRLSLPTVHEAIEGCLGTEGGRMLTTNMVLNLLLFGDYSETKLFQIDSDRLGSWADQDSELVSQPESIVGDNETPPAGAIKKKSSTPVALLRRNQSKGDKSTPQSNVKGTTKSKKGGKGIGRIRGLLGGHGGGTPTKKHKNQVDSANENSWSRERSKYLDIWYRCEKDLSVSVKVRGKLPCALFEVIAILNETDLAHNWAPFMKSAKKEHQMSKCSKLILQVYDYPLLGLKETVMYTFGVNCLSECGCVMIFCRPPLEKVEEFLGFPVPKKGNIARVQGATLCFLLFPVKMGEQTTLELYANFIHGLRFVPMKLITYVVKKIVKDIFVSIAKISNKFHETKYAGLIQENPAFYGWMKDTIKEFINQEDQTLRTAHGIDSISLASFNLEDFSAD